MVEIIHLGDYWNEEKMIGNKFNIMKDNKEVGRNFRRAYGYLAGAKGIYDNIKANMDEAIYPAKVNKIIGKLIIEIFGEIVFGNDIGKERHLFGSAITPEGIKDYLETVIDLNEKIFVLKGVYDSAQSDILKEIAKVGLNKGYDVELFHNHFIPEKVDHIVIKNISTAITASSKFNKKDNKVIDIDSCLNRELLKTRKEEIKLDNEKLKELINLAVSNIAIAKKVHDRMEEYYIPNMDFKGVDELRKNILNRILKLNK